MPLVDMKDMLQPAYDNSYVVRAINLDCNGIMVDASHEPIPKNIRSMADMAQTYSVPVEGELGYLPGVECQEMSGLSIESGNEHTPGRQSNP
jgi:fructose/tagatose bisphosphate aldolase